MGALDQTLSQRRRADALDADRVGDLLELDNPPNVSIRRSVRLRNTIPGRDGASVALRGIPAGSARTAPSGRRLNEKHPAVGTRPLEVPCLMLTAEWDPGLRPEFAEPMRALCPDLELHGVEKVGHWVQQEAPEVVNRCLLGWLSRFAR